MFATEAFDLKIAVAPVKGIAENRGWLSRALEAEHTLVPRLAGEPIGGLTRPGGPLRRSPDRGAVNALSLDFVPMPAIKAKPAR